MINITNSKLLSELRVLIKMGRKFQIEAGKVILGEQIKGKFNGREVKFEAVYSPETEHGWVSVEGGSTEWYRASDMQELVNKAFPMEEIKSIKDSSTAA